MHFPLLLSSIWFHSLFFDLFPFSVACERDSLFEICLLRKEECAWDASSSIKSRCQYLSWVPAQGACLTGCAEFFLPNLIAYFWYYSPSAWHFLMCIFFFELLYCSHFSLGLFKYSCFMKQHLAFVCLFLLASSALTLGYFNISLLCLATE